jgi:hypothetical protein
MLGIDLLVVPEALPNPGKKLIPVTRLHGFR